MLLTAGSARCGATKSWKSRPTGGGSSGWFSLRVLMATGPQLGADATEVLRKLRLLSWAFLSGELPWDTAKNLFLSCQGESTLPSSCHGASSVSLQCKTGLDNFITANNISSKASYNNDKGN